MNRNFSFELYVPTVKRWIYNDSLNLIHVGILRKHKQYSKAFIFCPDTPVASSGETECDRLLFGGDQYRFQPCYLENLRTDCSAFFIDKSAGSVRWVPTAYDGFKVMFNNGTDTGYVVEMRSRWLERSDGSCWDLFAFGATSDGEETWVEFLAVNSTSPADPEPLILEKQVRSTRLMPLPSGQFYFLLRAGRRIAASQTITIDGIWVYSQACMSPSGGMHQYCCLFFFFFFFFFTHSILAYDVAIRRPSSVIYAFYRIIGNYIFTISLDNVSISYFQF